MDFLPLAISSAIVGIFFIVWGYFAIRPDPVCHICKQPLPSGYYTITPDGPICKWCAVASGISPWYED